MKGAWYTFHGMPDFALRSALFQALLLESIPVISDADALRHVPLIYSDVLDYSKFTVVLNGSVAGGFMDKSSSWHSQNVIDLLIQQFNQTQALRMIEHMHGLRQVMQFALNPNHDLLRFDQMLEMKRDDDAFTFSMKALMRRLCSKSMLRSDKCELGGRGK
jgi:hypothetical protein